MGGPERYEDWMIAQDALVVSELRRKQCVETLEGLQLDDRLGIGVPKPSDAHCNLGVARSEAMRKPCQVERDLEQRLGLNPLFSSKTRVIAGNVQNEAAQDRALERELEERL